MCLAPSTADQVEVAGREVHHFGYSVPTCSLNTQGSRGAGGNASPAPPPFLNTIKYNLLKKPHGILINMEFDPKQRDAIIDTATQLTTLLTNVGEDLWVNTIDHAIDILKEDKYEEGMQLLLSMFGGMGSLNDLVIDPYSGHPVSNEALLSINQQLKLYLNELYSLIKK